MPFEVADPTAIPFTQKWMRLTKAPEWSTLAPEERAYARQEFVWKLEQDPTSFNLSKKGLSQLKRVILSDEGGDNILRGQYDPNFEDMKGTLIRTPAAPIRGRPYKPVEEIDAYKHFRAGHMEFRTPKEIGLTVGRSFAKTMAWPFGGLAEHFARGTWLLPEEDFQRYQAARQAQGWRGTGADVLGAMAGYRLNPLLGAAIKFIQRGGGQVLRHFPWFRRHTELAAKVRNGVATKAELRTLDRMLHLLPSVQQGVKKFAPGVIERNIARAAVGPLLSIPEGELDPKRMAAISGFSLILGNVSDLLGPSRSYMPELEMANRVGQLRTVYSTRGEAFQPYHKAYEVPRASATWWRHGGYETTYDPSRPYTPAPGALPSGYGPPIPAAAGEGLAGVPSARGGYDWMPKEWQGVPVGKDVHGKLWSLRVPEKAPLGWVDSAIMAGAKVVLPNLVGRNVAEIQELVGAIEKGKQFALPAKATEAKRKASLVAKRGIVTGRNVDIAQRLFREELEGAYDAATRQHDTEALKYAEEVGDETRAHMESTPFMDAEYLRTNFPGIWDDLSPNERMRVTRKGVSGGVAEEGRRRFSKGQKQLPAVTQKQVEQQYLKLMRKVYDPRTGAVKKDKETGKLIKHTKAELQQIDEIETLGKAYHLDLTFRTVAKGFMVSNPEDYMVTDNAGQAVMTEGVHNDFGQIVPNFDDLEEFTQWWINEKLGGFKFTKGRGGRTGIAGAKDQAYHEAMGAITKYEFPFPQLRDLEDRMADLAQRGHITAPEMEELHGALETLQRGETPDVLKKVEPIPLSRLSETGVKLQAAQRAIADQKAFDKFEKDLGELAEAEAAEVIPSVVGEVVQPRPPWELTRAEHLALTIKGWDTSPPPEWNLPESSRGINTPLDELTARELAELDLVARGDKPAAVPDFFGDEPELLNDWIASAKQRGLHVTRYTDINGDPTAVAGRTTAAAQRVIDAPVGTEELGKALGYRTHKEHVIRALQRGQKVPERVLKDYPDLAEAPAPAAPAPATTEQRRATEYPEPTQYEIGKPPQMELGLQQQPYLIDRVADKIAAEATVWKSLGPALTQGYQTHVDRLAAAGTSTGPYLETIWRSAEPERWHSYEDAVAALVDQHQIGQVVLQEARANATSTEAQKYEAIGLERENAINDLLDSLDDAAGKILREAESVMRIEPDDLPPANSDAIAETIRKTDFDSIRRRGDAGMIDIQAMVTVPFKPLVRFVRATARLLRRDIPRSRLEMARLMDDLYAGHVFAWEMREKHGYVIEQKIRRYLEKFPEEVRDAKRAEIPWLIDLPGGIKAQKNPLLSDLAGEKGEAPGGLTGYFRWATDRIRMHVNESLDEPIGWRPQYVSYMIDWPKDMPLAQRQAIQKALEPTLRQFRAAPTRYRKSATMGDFVERLAKLSKQLGLKEELRPITDLTTIIQRYTYNMYLMKYARDFMRAAVQLEAEVTTGKGADAQKFMLPMVSSAPPREYMRYYRRLPDNKMESYWHLLIGGSPKARAAALRAIGDPQTAPRALTRPIYILADYFDSLLNVIPDLRGMAKPEAVWRAATRIQRGIIFAPNPGIYGKNVLSDALIWHAKWWDPTKLSGLPGVIRAFKRGGWMLRDPSPEATEMLEKAILAGVNVGMATDFETYLSTVMTATNNRALKVLRVPGVMARWSANLMFRGFGRRIWLGTYQRAVEDALKNPKYANIPRNEIERVVAAEINTTFGRMPRHKLQRTIEKWTSLLLTGPMWTPGNIDILTKGAFGRGFGTASQTPWQLKRQRNQMIAHLIGGAIGLGTMSVLLTGLNNKIRTGKWKWMFKDYPARDWFYIGTGKYDERDREIMISPFLYAYFIDYYRIWRDPAQTSRNKLVNPTGLLLDWWLNRTMFGQKLVPEEEEGQWNRWKIRLHYGIWQSVPQTRVFLNAPGTSDPASMRLIAYALGTNIKHMRPGEHRAPDIYSVLLDTIGQHNYISSLWAQDIRDLLDGGAYEPAARMMVERYSRPLDVFNGLASYFTPLNYMWYSRHTELMREDSLKQMTEEQRKRFAQVRKAEKDEFFDAEYKQILPLLSAALEERGKPLPVDLPHRDRYETWLEEHGGIRGTRRATPTEGGRRVPGRVVPSRPVGVR